MNNPDTERKLIREYLVGSLAAGLRAEVESRVFTDPDYKERVLSVEEELADEYFNGQMDEGLRAEYERRFLATPRQRLEAHIVRELKRGGAASVNDGGEPSPRPDAVPRPVEFPARQRLRAPLVGLAVAAALVLAVIFGWIILRTWRGERPGAEQADGSRRSAIELELARLNSRAGRVLEGGESERRPAPLTLPTLTPGSSRSGGAAAAQYPDFIIPPDADHAGFRLELRLPKDAYRRFRVAFVTADKRELFGVWLEPDADDRQTLEMIVPTRYLEDGEHWIQLSGADASGRLLELQDHYYYFRIRRQ